MPRKSQRGILRPRVTGPDLELREGILKVLRDLQKNQALSQIAEALGVSEKTLSRYLSDKGDRPATLGGDILFRICEAGHPVTCRGKTLQCMGSGSESETKLEQLRFEFVASIDVLLPSRKLVARVERVNRRSEAI
jgi:transcriptional regulator with XRE-family HTH domain